MPVDGLPEPVIAFVHRGQSAMHAVAARVEPTVDRQSMSLGDIHHRFVGRALARLQGRVRIVVDRCLFGLERLPVIRRVAPRTLFRL